MQSKTKSRLGQSLEQYRRDPGDVLCADHESAEYNRAIRQLVFSNSYGYGREALDKRLGQLIRPMRKLLEPR